MLRHTLQADGALVRNLIHGVAAGVATREYGMKARAHVIYAVLVTIPVDEVRVI